MELKVCCTGTLSVISTGNKEPINDEAMSNNSFEDLGEGFGINSAGILEPDYIPLPDSTNSGTINGSTGLHVKKCIHMQSE